jgi:hypothetical protein
MTDTVEAGGKTWLPWHFWLVCTVAVFWNGFGVFDFTMSMVQGEAHLRSMQMTDAQIAYHHQMPVGVVAAWGLGALGAGLATVLLILRRRWALHVFAASLAGLLISLLYTYLLSNGGALSGQQGAIMSAIITAACLFFIWYAWVATRAGHLR